MTLNVLAEQNTQQQISQAWNYWSQSYDGSYDFGFGSIVEKLAWQGALRQLVGPARLLMADVGSGTGQLALLLAELGHKVCGFDMSVGMLKLARQKADAAGLPVSFLLGDAEALPLADQAVDVVINRMVFWILRQPVLALREWTRVVKPGGWIIVIDGLWGQRITLRQQAERLFWRCFFRWEAWQARRNSTIYGYASNFRKLDQESPSMHYQRHAEVLALFEQAGLTEITLSFLPVVDAARQQAQPWFWRWQVTRPFYVITASVPAR